MECQSSNSWETRIFQQADDLFSSLVAGGIVLCFCTEDWWEAGNFIFRLSFIPTTTTKLLQQLFSSLPVTKQMKWKTKINGSLGYKLGNAVKRRMLKEKGSIHNFQFSIHYFSPASFRFISSHPDSSYACNLYIKFLFPRRSSTIYATVCEILGPSLLPHLRTWKYGL